MANRISSETTTHLLHEFSYVPHANKALRSFNMYLNVRTPPPTAPWPLSLIFSNRNSDNSPPAQPITRGRPDSSPRGAGRRITTIPPIPPSTNPRGELIFTSRVDKHFRDSYERYREAFERRRSEKVLAEASMSTWGRLSHWLSGNPPRPPVRRDLALDKDGFSRTPTNSRGPSRSVTPIESVGRAPG